MEQQNEQPIEESIFAEEEFSMKGYDKHIRNARILLFVLAGLTLLLLVNAAPFDSPGRIISGGIIVLFAGVFIVLALWTKKRPYTALLCALIFYVSIVGIAALVDPALHFQGWIWKVVIIILLILGLRNGKEAQDMMDTFGKKSDHTSYSSTGRSHLSTSSSGISLRAA